MCLASTDIKTETKKWNNSGRFFRKDEKYACEYCYNGPDSRILCVPDL